MIPLPIDPELPRIIDAIRQSRSAVIVAEPGAGKTTRLPPAILLANFLTNENPNLVMLQPRRVAARLAARRIADEQNWFLGNEVGYQVRFEKFISKNTRLRILTEGILSRQLLDDPYLPGIGCVVLDEFHERNLNSDLAIAMLRELRQTVRPDLILIVMSATLDAEPVSKFLGGAPIINVPGHRFEVELEYRGMTGGRIEEKTADAVRDCLSDSRGDILVFLPGAEEIRRTQVLLDGLPASAGRDSADFFPLHGSLPPAEQDLALSPSDRRKVILATNIAETSLTIPGVDTVIDTGLERLPIYDTTRGMDRLDLRRISKASATQRAGRAVRTGPGKCVRLWTAKEQQALEDYQPAEVHRVDLSTAVLSIYEWGAASSKSFDWFERPDHEMLTHAEELLQMLGAIKPRDHERSMGVPPMDHGRDARATKEDPELFTITDLGRRILNLPVHVRVARLMLDAHGLGLAKEAAGIAAIVSEKDFLRSQTSAHIAADSDLLERLRMLNDPRDNMIDPITRRRLIQIREQLLRLLSPSPGTPGEGQGGGLSSFIPHPSSLNSSPPRFDCAHRRPEYQGKESEQLLKLPLLAYPDRVVRRRTTDPNTGLMVGGIGVRLVHESVVRRGEFFIAIDVQGDTRSRKSEAMVRMASRIERDWLDELFPDSIQRRRELFFDSARQKVIQQNQTWYRDLLIAESEDAPTDFAAAGAVLGEALRTRAKEFFSADPESQQWLARLSLLQTKMPEHPWPNLDETRLADLLSAAATNRRSVSEMPSSIDLLKSTLLYPLDRLFETHAPISITVPTGNKIKIDYTSANGPVLAVRLQELFGLPQTPTICNGRAPLVLHLLGPNYRPVQITSDLASFWNNAYFQVRKDLKARYPKHSWPENPLTAPPQAKGRRRIT